MFNGTVWSAQDASADATSDAVDIRHGSQIALQLTSASGTRAGTLAVQVSVDQASWDTLDTYTVSAGSAFSQFTDVQTGFPWMRLVYTDGTSGTGEGSLYAFAFVKRGNKG